MDRIEDERVRFYLRHRELITAWAALEKEARESVHQWLTSLRRGIEERASGDGEDLVVYHDSSKLEEATLLYRARWVEVLGGPILGIGLGWVKNEVSLDRHRLPWVGVRVDCSKKHGKALVPVLLKRLKPLAEPGFLTGRIGEYWPVYRRLQAPNEDYWENFDPLRQLIETTIKETWQRFSDEVELGLGDYSDLET